MESINLGFKRNARDFSSLTTADGKKIKPGRIIRSAQLSDLSKKEILVLKNDYNLKMIIDLRSDSEIEKKPETIIDGVEYYHIPYFNESTLGVTSGMGSDVLSAIKNAESREDLYNFIPDLYTVYSLLGKDDFSCKQISKCIKKIMSNREGAVLFHCTAGKDRTGVTSAIILKLLGVDDRGIFDDYEYTNLVSSKNARKYSKLARYFFRDKKLADKVYNVYLAKPEYLRTFLDSIEQKYGSFDYYVKEVLCISDEETEQFRNNILV